MNEDKTAPTAGAPQSAAAEKQSTATKAPTARRTRPTRAATASTKALAEVALEPERQDPFQSAKRVWPD
jgi:hypothetical protein